MAHHRNSHRSCTTKKANQSHRSEGSCTTKKARQSHNSSSHHSSHQIESRTVITLQKLAKSPQVTQVLEPLTHTSKISRAGPMSQSIVIPMLPQQSITKPPTIAQPVVVSQLTSIASQSPIIPKPPIIAQPPTILQVRRTPQPCKTPQSPIVCQTPKISQPSKVPQLPKIRQPPAKVTQIANTVNTVNPDQFNREFYIKAYKDVNPRFCNPYMHYYSIGQREERLPNAQRFEQLYPQFDADVYASNNSDLSHFIREELMCHFHHYGRFECRIYRKNQQKYVI